MATNKTIPNDISVHDHLRSLNNAQQREDATTLAKLMEEVTGARPVMWGSSIVGFGNNHYVYESGRVGDTPAISFAVRKNAITLYGVMLYGQNENNVALAQHLGPHTHGKGCLYIKTLDGIDMNVLKEMVHNAYHVRSDKN